MRYFTECGSPYRTVLKLGFDKETGAEEIFPVGVENFQEIIEAAAPSCDLNVIIARVRAGELDLLQANKGMYGDFTNMPMTLQEIMQNRIDAKYMYDNLPDETKKKLDFESFMKDAGSKEWLEGLGFKFDEVKEEVKKDAEPEQ